MARVKFTGDYDHRWPSGAETAYKDNWEGTVKSEVAEAAVKAGKARRVKLEPVDEARARRPGRPRKTRTVGVKGGKIDQAAPAETLPGNLPVELAEPQAVTPNLHVDASRVPD